MALKRRSYVGVTITLTLADTNYNILELVQAVVAAESTNASAQSDVPGACRILRLQNASGNTASVRIGDALLSGSRSAYELNFVTSAPGQDRVYESTINNVDVASLYARSGSAAQKLNVEIVTC